MSFPRSSNLPKKEGFPLKLKRIILALALMAALLLSCGATAFADPSAFSLALLIGENTVTVRAMLNEYPGNYYISLTDLSAGLDGTRCAFRFEYQNTPADGEFFTVNTRQSSGAWSGAGNATEDPWISSFVPFRNRIFVDGPEHRYYTYREGRDLYMSLTDIQLMLDITAEFTEEGIRLYPDRPFRADLEELDRQGYFDAFSAVLVADADTGDILFSRNAGDPVPIASISKLMTYLLLAEGIQRGEISSYDSVGVSEKAAALSRGVDAMVTLYTDQRYPYQDMLGAMLLASSNECALALAEHLCGSEEAFVERMNQRAEELGLETAHFYNPNGLPVYLQQALSTKVQNCMSAEDLFTLCSLLIHEHPELLNITRERYGSMPSLKYVTANSNALVFNLPGCNGLKTGSTNKAGSCLAASLPVTAGGETHTAVAIVLGSETAYGRNQAAEILLRAARDTWQEQGSFAPAKPEPSPSAAPAATATPAPSASPAPTGKAG